MSTVPIYITTAPGVRVNSGPARLDRDGQKVQLVEVIDTAGAILPEVIDPDTLTHLVDSGLVHRYDVPVTTTQEA